MHLRSASPRCFLAAPPCIAYLTAVHTNETPPAQPLLGNSIFHVAITAAVGCLDMMRPHCQKVLHRAPNTSSLRQRLQSDGPSRPPGVDVRPKGHKAPLVCASPGAFVPRALSLPSVGDSTQCLLLFDLKTECFPVHSDLIAGAPALVPKDVFFGGPVCVHYHPR